MNKSFTQEGVTYTVRPPSIFDEDMHMSLWVDVGKQWAKEHEVSLDDIPRSIDRLLSRYVSWMQATSFDGKTPLATIDLYDMSKAVSQFDTWKAIVLADGQVVATQWASAYKAVTEGDDTPKNGSGGNGNGTPSSNSPIVATNPAS